MVRCLSEVHYSIEEAVRASQAAAPQPATDCGWGVSMLTAHEGLAKCFSPMICAAPPVAAAALRGWSLLLSTLPNSRLSSSGIGGGGAPSTVEGQLAGLGKALNADDVAVRQAAGEGAALLYSQSGLAADRDSPGGSG